MMNMLESDELIILAVYLLHGRFCLAPSHPNPYKRIFALFKYFIFGRIELDKLKMAI